MADSLLYDLFRAYYDARKNKRNTINQLRFEMDFEHSLVELAREIRNGTYKVSPGIGFIIHNPVQREIFAAEFRDRVVHHLVANDIMPIVERSLITDCYSCRVGYGTTFGVDRLKHHIRSCTDNYTRKAYALKLDIQGYFMSINREVLHHKVEELLLRYANRISPDGRRWKEVIDMERTFYLLKEIIFNDPTQNCHLKGWPQEWEGLPPSKSLFYSGGGCGLPIGNLTSQVFSNIYLTDFDQYVKRTLGMAHYGRYVDDFYIIHRDKEVLKGLIEPINSYLRDKLDLVLHPRKIVLQRVEKGVSFLGVHVKPHRDYLITRTKRKANSAFYSATETADKKENELLRAVFNSYLGYMKRYKTYYIRKKLVQKCITVHSQFTPAADFSKIMIESNTPI